MQFQECECKIQNLGQHQVYGEDLRSLTIKKKKIWHNNPVSRRFGRYSFQIQIPPASWLKTFVFKGSPLTAADLGSCLNFTQLARWAEFKKEPKSAAVKDDPLKKILLVTF